MTASVPARGVKSLLKTIVLVPAVWVWMIISFSALSIMFIGDLGASHNVPVATSVHILAFSTPLVLYIVGAWLFQCVFDKKPFKLLGFTPDKKTLPALMLGMFSSVAIVTIVVRTFVRLGTIKQQDSSFYDPTQLWFHAFELLLFAFVFKVLDKSYCSGVI